MGNISSKSAAKQTRRPSIDDTLTVESMPPKPTLRSRSYRVSSILSKLPLIDQPSFTPVTPCSQTTPLPSLTNQISESSTRKKPKSYPQKRRKSSLLNVNNGITGKFICSRICKIATKFWLEHVDTLSVKEQLEIGCSIFFSMISTNADMKHIIQTNLTNKQQKMETMGLKYLEMMGWLIRYLVTDNVDLYALLTKLGVMHQSMGIKIEMFNPMLQAMHEAFSYYFLAAYSIEVKYALDEIFSLSAQVMTGQDLKCNSHLMRITEQFQGDEVPFLKNLNVCLKCNIGREYLYRFLSQTWCDELVIFLKEFFRFKNLTTDTQRFMVARDITKTSIEPTAAFTLNLAYGTRRNILYQMAELKEKFLAKEPFEIKADFFSEVEREVYKLVMDNHWTKFVRSIEMLQFKSFNYDE